MAVCRGAPREYVLKTGVELGGSDCTVRVIDVQAWGAMLFGADPYWSALDWALENLAYDDPSTPGWLVFDYNEDRDGIWYEGTAQMAAAFDQAGRANDFCNTIGALHQALAGGQYSGGIPAAKPDQIQTGDEDEDEDSLSTGFCWRYYDRLALAATSWYIFAQNRYNPFGADLLGKPGDFNNDGNENGDDSGEDDASSIDGGYNITSDLWSKAVLNVSNGPITLLWRLVGADRTSNGDQVISGYFYANPKDFAYGSQYNPEVFVKVYISQNGWANMAFNHVTVDPVTISSAHNYDGQTDQTGNVTLQSRLLEHTYTGVAIDQSLQSVEDQQSGGASANGYSLGANLWTQAILQVTNNPVTLIWKEVGTDTTPAGAKVISGYFYADPADFAYGSPYNPEVFVKVYIDPSGWANMAFNHVTVDPVSIESAHQNSGASQQNGSATLNSRLIEHSYTGVSLQ